MDHEEGCESKCKISVVVAKVHSKCNTSRPQSSPHVSTTSTDPSTSGLPQQTTPPIDTMSNDSEDDDLSIRRNDGGAIADWLAGGPAGSKAAVLVFRSCVLASQTPSMETVEPAMGPAPSFRSVGNNTGTSILLNKAKLMAKRLIAEPQKLNVSPRNVMHEVMETFGTAKYTGSAYVVRHISGTSIPEEVNDDDVDGESIDHTRDICDVLDDLEKIRLRKNILENTTTKIPIDYAALLPHAPSLGAELKQPSRALSPPPKEPTTKNKRGHKGKSKRNKIQPQIENDDSEHLLMKPENVQVLDSDYMPARIFRMTYKLINTETKLLHRLLQAHGLEEIPHDAKEFNLLWSGVHPKPDVLRSLSPYQRVNHFPRSYELTRKDKLFKNVEKMQYFRGLKHFDFIPTTFLMPNEFKDLCTAHFKTKGPWIVKPAASSRGRGIYIVNTPEQIPKGDNVVVAKYIDKPLLIGGHKCDLRLYVCLTSIDPLLIYLYEEGLVRFATVKYDKTNKNLWNPCMHLCNYSINKYHTDYIKCDDPNAGNIGHKWTLSALLRHLRKQGRDTTALMAAIEDLVIKAILSSAQTMTIAARAFVPNFFNCFELFGFDILIDEMLKPWLLEINLSPSLACESPLDARVKSALIADTLTLVGLPAVPIVTGDNNPNSLKMRIGACRRVHSAENVNSRGKGHGGSGPAASALTSEELRLVRAVKAQYSRRGGYVRIFPSQNSWQKYSQYLDPVSGVPVCSTSLNNAVPYAVVQHNYNLLVHTHVLPHFRHAHQPANAPDTPERLKRYEAVKVTSTAPAVTLCDQPSVLPACDVRRAKELIKRQLQDGMRLTMGECRRAFGMFLTLVLKRISTPSSDQIIQHAGYILKFLKRASSSLRIPYSNIKTPAPKMLDKDRCAIIAKQLNDFLYVYNRETDLYTNSEDQDGCVSNIHFAQFLYGASEADLEDVLLTFLRTQRQVVTFIGDGRMLYCVDLPPSSLGTAAPRSHTLLRYLTCLTPLNARKYKSVSLPTGEIVELMEVPKVSPAFSANSNTVLKDSLKEEKPLEQALKYARS